MDTHLKLTVSRRYNSFYPILAMNKSFDYLPRPLSADSWREWSFKLDKNGSMGRSVLLPLSISSCCRLISCWRCFSLSRSSCRSWSLSCCCLTGVDCDVFCHGANMTPVPGVLCCKCAARKKKSNVETKTRIFWNWESILN